MVGACGEQFFDITGGEHGLLAEELRDERDHGDVLNRFHAEKRRKQIGSVSNYAVIGQEYGVVIPQQWLDRIAQF